jgi:hypothetical protein
MWWKKSMRRERRTAAAAGLLCLVLGLPAAAFPVHRIKAVDADNHNIVLNRTGVITALIGTSEDSQQAARQAGIAVYPFQGRSDFQLIVAVDLRGTLANWAPSIAVSRMRSSLDGEALELKPYFLKNGNRSNPRGSCHVIPDFNGKLFTQLGWPQTSSSLRAIIYGADGREFQRFDTIDNMDVLYNSVRAAIAAHLALRKAHEAAAPPIPVTRSTALSPPMPPLPPAKPVAPAKP